MTGRTRNQRSTGPFGATFGLTVLLAPIAVPAQAAPGVRTEFRGQVLGPLGDPLTAAEVWVESRGTRLLDRPALTDGEGRYLTRVAVPDIEATYYSREWATVCATAPGCTVGDISYSPGRSFPFRLQLWDAGRIEGRVLGPNEQPVTDAVVWVRKTGIFVRRLYPDDLARTDEHGEFVLQKSPVGRISVCAWSPTSGAAVRDYDLAAPVGHLEMRLETGSWEPLRIRVRAADVGAAAGQIGLGLNSDPGGALPPELGNAVLDASGTATFPAVPVNGLLHLSAYSSRWVVDPPRQRLERGWPESTPRTPDGRFELQVDIARTDTLPLKGIVADDRGDPVADLELAFDDASGSRAARCRTDAEGHFEVFAPGVAGRELRVRPGNDRWVMAQAVRYRMTEVMDYGRLDTWWFQADPDEELDLHVTRAARIEGRIVDSEGRPQVDRVLVLRGLQGTTWDRLAITWSDRRGRYRFEGLRPPPHPLRIAVGWEGSAPTGESFELAPGEQLTDHLVTVAPAGSVRGIVRDAAGKPFPGAIIMMNAHDEKNGASRSSFLEHASSSLQGQFGFADVAPGHYRFAVIPSGSVFEFEYTAEVEVRSGERATIELRL